MLSSELFSVLFLMDEVLNKLKIWSFGMKNEMKNCDLIM